MKTYNAKKEDLNKGWWVVDAEGLILGRLATKIASCLRGKDKPIYTPYTDAGDFVIVVNAEKIVLICKMLADKIYYSSSVFFGGLRETPAGKMLQSKPENVLRLAVKGMLPKNTLGRAMLKKLKIYAGGGHPHDAQCPKVMNI